MQPQYLDQYGSWYRIVDGELECTPAWFDGSIDVDEWSTVEEPAPNTGEWEEAIEFLNTINERFKSQFTPRQFGLSRNHYLQKGYTPAPKILHIWDNDNLVISTLHGFLEANAESLTPDEMKAINLLDMEDFRVSIIGNHCGWVTIERVQ